MQVGINPWNWGEWTVRKVARNCHISVERNHYSVPFAHIGREVDVRKSERMIEVFLEGGGERIAVHPRKKGKNLYTTRDEHMPKRLNAVQHIRSPDVTTQVPLTLRYTLGGMRGATN